MIKVEQLTLQLGENDTLEVSIVTYAIKIERGNSTVFIPLDLAPIVAKVLMGMSKEDK